MSSRACSLKELFETVKSLKEVSIMAGKSGSIAGDTLTQSIMKIQTAARKLIADTTLGFPMHWVQACWNLTLALDLDLDLGSDRWTSVFRRVQN